MKTVFELEEYAGVNGKLIPSGVKLNIIGMEPIYKTYVSLNIPGEEHSFFIPDKDLERFAVNILKFMKSKHLRHPSKWKRIPSK